MRTEKKLVHKNNKVPGRSEQSKEDWAMRKKRQISWWAVSVSGLALISFVCQTWLGVNIPEWDKFTLLFLGLLSAFGIER